MYTTQQVEMKLPLARFITLEPGTNVGKPADYGSFFFVEVPGKIPASDVTVNGKGIIAANKATVTQSDTAKTFVLDKGDEVVVESSNTDPISVIVVGTIDKICKDGKSTVAPKPPNSED